MLINQTSEKKLEEPFFTIQLRCRVVVRHMAKHKCKILSFVVVLSPVSKLFIFARDKRGISFLKLI